VKDVIIEIDRRIRRADEIAGNPPSERSRIVQQARASTLREVRKLIVEKTDG
jgi:hypothetical protein